MASNDALSRSRAAGMDYGLRIEEIMARLVNKPHGVWSESCTFYLHVFGADHGMVILYGNGNGTGLDGNGRFSFGE